MFEIPKPASNQRSQVFNDGAQTLASGAFFLLAYPALSRLETIAQKLKALSLEQAVPDVSLVWMQAQAVFLHPYFDLFQCRLRFWRGLAQDDEIVGIALHAVTQL